MAGAWLIAKPRPCRVNFALAHVIALDADPWSIGTLGTIEPRDLSKYTVRRRFMMQPGPHFSNASELMMGVDGKPFGGSLLDLEKHPEKT